MPYVICDNNNNYLKQNRQCSFVIVNNIKDATKWDKVQKANNVCNNNVRASKKFKDYDFQVRYVTQENQIVYEPAKSIELDFDILDKIKEISIFTRQIEERRLYLIDEIHKIDLEIVDIEHAAEFYNLNASQGYKLYKLLHDSRNKRRELKDELQKINSTLNTSIKSEDIEKLEKSIIGLDSRQYTPRINKELFGV